LLFSAITTTLLTAVNCTHVAIVNPAGQERFGVPREEFVLSVTVLLLAIAFAPLVLAPLSETVGGYTTSVQQLIISLAET